LPFFDQAPFTRANFSPFRCVVQASTRRGWTLLPLLFWDSTTFCPRATSARHTRPPRSKPLFDVSSSALSRLGISAGLTATSSCFSAGGFPQFCKLGTTPGRFSGYSARFRKGCFFASFRFFSPDFRPRSWMTAPVAAVQWAFFHKKRVGAKPLLLSDMMRGFLHRCIKRPVWVPARLWLHSFQGSHEKTRRWPRESTPITDLVRFVLFPADAFHFSMVLPFT